MLKKVIRNIVSKKTPRWPLPLYDNNIQPHFFFLVTPPYSGSTAIAKILETSHKIMALHSNAEGQWIVPGLCEKDRWDPDKKINYESVKAVWLHTFQKEKKRNPSLQVVIEKSPPNILRIKKLSSQFSDSSFVVNNRDPYANCASILYRNHNAENISDDIRIETLQTLTRDWIMRSRYLKEFVIKSKTPLITYEKFCENPSNLIEVLDLPAGVSDTINLNAKVKVKDYNIQGISNHNKQQISNLSGLEIECISGILKSEIPLLEFFGYGLM